MAHRSGQHYHGAQNVTDTGKPGAASIEGESAAPDGHREDAALLARLRTGDEAAYEELIRTHGGKLLTTIQRLLRNEDEALDAFQETFLSAFKSIERFQGQSKLSTWLHRIAVNAALMRLRKRSRRPDEVAAGRGQGPADKQGQHVDSLDALQPRFDASGHFADQVGRWVDPLRVAERAELRELVHAAIDELPDTHRTVLLLRDIEGFDTDETARELGVTPNAVKVRLHRARQALRTVLEQRFSDSGQETR